jgi:hypothetical protein
MRLTKMQITAIREIFVVYFMKEDKIWLFGSRVDDTKKDGDIYLYIETNYTDLSAVAQKETSF